MDEIECRNYMEENSEEIFTFMLTNLGSIDCELRDDLIYKLLVKLLSGHHLTKQQLTHAVHEAMSERYLFASIGESGTDSVFTRSFSSLWLSGLFWLDAEQSYMDPDLRKSAMEKSATYLLKEQDIRGFVEDKGWAHSIAHGADLAMMIASHPHTEKRLIPIILEGVASCFWKGGVYINDEDERLVAILITLVNNDYPEEVIIEWVEQVFDRLNRAIPQNAYSHSYFHARTNILQFMKTLYFALKKNNLSPRLRSDVSFFIQNS